MKTIDRDAAAGEIWDFVVVGTGMGGATFGYEMARRGQRVLFCERGMCSTPPQGVIAGEYVETRLPGARPPTPDDAMLLARSGRCTWEVDDVSYGRSRSSIPFIGAGAGGSSALYGMALERFAPSDFEPGRFHAQAGETTAPKAWPISYDELAPHYAAAEALYRVRGERDPLRLELMSSTLPVLPPPSSAGQELRGFLEARGIHPYRLPLACEAVPGCSTCQGYLCPRDCKNDSSRVCLRPAVERLGASILENCEVTRLVSNGRRVKEAMCVTPQGEFAVRGHCFILAAGALMTPAILLRSSSGDGPTALGNANGLVGRNLMRHLIDLHVLSAPPGMSFDNRAKELAFSDFSIAPDGAKLGGVQSFGRLPPAEVMFAALKEDARQSPFGWASPLLPIVRPVLMRHLRSLERDRLILASTLEDLPYADHRVSLSGSGRLELNYRVRDYDRSRLERFRSLLRTLLTGRGHSIVKQADNNQRLAHVCGTCRFGSDPKTSVVGRDCRVHAVDNLLVVDASVFPTSGGTNPSLTIAANAIRVAHSIGGPI